MGGVKGVGKTKPQAQVTPEDAQKAGREAARKILDEVGIKTSAKKLGKITKPAGEITFSLPAPKELRVDDKKYIVMVIKPKPQLMKLAMEAGYTFVIESRGKYIYSRPEDKSEIRRALQEGSAIIVASE